MGVFPVTQEVGSDPHQDASSKRQKPQTPVRDQHLPFHSMLLQLLPGLLG